MKSSYPLVVIGAGPGGLTAAATAARSGVDVALLDEQPALGGQIFRHIESIPKQRAQLLGPDYCRGGTLVQILRNSSVDYLPQTSVWSLEQLAGGGCEIALLRDGRARTLRADRIILAGGAMERPVPFPGWTLPGVMNAGAAQILLKTSGVVPAGGVIIAGTGPLLLLLAWQYLHAGVEVRAILELSPSKNMLSAAPRLPQALLAGHYILRGFKYLRELRKAGIPVLYGVHDLHANGDEHVEAVQYRRLGKQKKIETDTLLVHFGLVPNLHLSDAAGCASHWHCPQQCWRPDADIWGNSSVPGVAVTGDNAAIGGARAAEHEGHLAGLEAARALGAISTEERDRRGRQDRAWMKADLHIRPFLEALHHLPRSLLNTPADDTVVCRCEEITAGQIRQAVRDGHNDPNQVKFFTRCGMGPCQGRQCAHAVAHIVAAETGKPIADQRAFRIRPPLQPITIGELAGLDNDEAAQ